MPAGVNKTVGSSAGTSESLATILCFFDLKKSRNALLKLSAVIFYNLFNRTLGKEKAVDVKLATDMIMLKDIYELAIIVTGDQDYVPAAKVIKDYGKRVVNVAFSTRSGELLPGGARRLNQVTDWSFIIPFSDLADHLQIGQLPLEADGS